MPPIMVVFWLIVAGASTALLGPPAIWEPPDPTARTDRGRRAPTTYNLTTSALWTQFAAPNVFGEETCRVTVVATVAGGARVRLRMDGVEQQIDNGWSIPVEVPVGMKYTAVAEFLDPIGGRLLATRTAEVKCLWPQIAPTRDQTLYDERGLRGYETPACPCPAEKEER